MRGVGVLIEVRLKPDRQKQFLTATALYRVQTREESGFVHFQLWGCGETKHTFVLNLMFRDGASMERHREAAHTHAWLEAIAETLDGQMAIRRVSGVASEPLPPRPRPRRSPPSPFLESATVWPEKAGPDFGWQPARTRRSSSRPPPLPPPLPLPAPAPPPPAPTSLPASALPRLSLTLNRLEIASVHETSIWGEPDPCLVIGGYQLEPGRTEGIGRALYRFGHRMQAPCELVRQDQLLDIAVCVEGYPLRVAILVLGVEENGAEGTRSLYQDLGDPAHFLVWRPSDAEPNPCSLADYAAHAIPNTTERVNVLHDHAAIAEALDDDTFVGAALAIVEFTARNEERILRCHTVSTDRKNDWRTSLRVRLG